MLGIDGDTLPIRMNASFGSYLESPEDIILGMREQGEVHAAAVLFCTSTASCGTGSTYASSQRPLPTMTTATFFRL